MGAWIASAKDASTTIIRNIQTDHPNAVVRVGFVGYRDYINGNDRIASIPLTTNTADVHGFISQLRARGGCGNFADVPGGLAEALEMRWEADAKVIILVGDAPCHGQEFHDRYNGTMHPSTPCIREQMRTMARTGIDFRFLEIVPANTAKMVAILQAEYASTLADDGLARSFASVSLSAVGDEIKFGDVVRQISSDSLRASKSRSVITSVKAVTTHPRLSSLDKVGEEDDDDLGNDDDDDDEKLLEPASAAKDTPVAVQWTPPTTTTALNWSDVEACPEISAVRHCKYIKRECSDMAKPQTITTSQATTIKFMPTPFAKGTMRTAHGMIDCKFDLRLVAKFYFGTTAAMDYHVRTDVEMTAIARRLAMEFSKSPHAGAGVDFIMTCWYEVKGRPLFTAEPHISGEYHKYNSNGGWVQTPMNDHVATAQAFSHFTHVHTLGKLMVVDLQGVGSIYTDPQLHTLNGNAYGHGNLGVAGMLSFLETHRCNHICRALQLPLCNDSDVSPATTARDDQTMTRSCSLCGTIYTMLHSAFVAELAAYAELLCATCTLKFETSMVAKPCVTCNKSREYSQFWYDMKGLETPKYCKACKVSGPKKQKTPLGPHGIVMKGIALAADTDGWAPLTKLGASLKAVDQTFDAKAHASGLLDLLRTFRNIEVRENTEHSGSYSARILKKRPLK
ncbi:hypothetical protein SPRG_21115 [Saprolegnia parasitica CBS 223.65]|uniref:Alpha-type protein kinase domain-containing protein n=1 Tax=Saprolegnia parasitica (strain CBS 223.65) TaxID=695850 RepID=A0A067C7W4_SAPPC|nr:hypothetical protein SPRG_21115 [Saprolegnia parasitica CBS 223.65]KDO22631.1 hypothetical protein SPRG_21115 [Saprolegnia parasitica CBS 223.65]|eukprot:XP_012206667.1 hypothetical protein SPRG_21115 [Saprolegnia parasitica CBS 223.65]